MGDFIVRRVRDGKKDEAHRGDQGGDKTGSVWLSDNHTARGRNRVGGCGFRTFSVCLTLSLPLYVFVVGPLNLLLFWHSSLCCCCCYVGCSYKL